MDSPHTEPSERDKLQKDVLWGYYLDLKTHARHAETMRSNAAGYALLIASALIAVITLDGKIGRNDWPLCLVLIVVSLFTTIYSLSYVDRYNRNKRRAHIVLEEIDRRFFDDQEPAHRTAGLRAAGEADSSRKPAAAPLVLMTQFHVALPSLGRLGSWTSFP